MITLRFSKKDLFKDFYIEEIEETTLDATAKKSDLLRISWKSINDNYVGYHNSSRTLESIKLMPMEIRTFIIRLSAK